MPAFQYLGPEGAGRLDAALALPASDYYESDCDATAAMFVALINNHPFQDGNKRYAIVATTVFLMLNGIMAVAADYEWEYLALSVARSEMSTASVGQFLNGRMFDVENTPAPAEGWLRYFEQSLGGPALDNALQTMGSLLQLVRDVDDEGGD